MDKTHILCSSVTPDHGHDVLVETSSHGSGLPPGARVALKVIADKVAVADPRPVAQVSATA
jgi:hypothetical protein